MAWAIWITGLPSCGKTTIAIKTREMLEKNGVKVKILQLDEIRRVITPKPRYTEEERDIVYASLAYMAKLLTESGVNVIIDATAHKQRYRDLARQLIPSFLEIYVKCPLEICIERERTRFAEYSPRDIYKKARLPSATVPGVNVVYEEPENAEVTIDSSKLSPEEAADRIINAILEKGWI
ncbi:MAG: adenylyl-sulfate kinase [Methanocellales archaeon]